MIADAIFWLTGAMALGAALLAVSRRVAVHGLLWLIVSLLAMAVLFLLLGAPFAAALEIIVYAGAIMVLFVFVVMMLNLGPDTDRREAEWLRPGVWIAPGLMALALGANLVAVTWLAGRATTGGQAVPPAAVGVALFGPYAIAVELASLLLLAGLVAAYHLARRAEMPADGGDA